MFNHTSAQSLAIGFDIGGTNLRAGVVTELGEVIDSRSVPTPGDSEQLYDAVVGLVEEIQAEYPVVAVGLAIAGFIDPQQEMVRFAPHLAWKDEPVREKLQARLSLPVIIEHDANSAAWGEQCFGAGKSATDWVFFAVGTGIGATIMINGEIYRGAFGTAPEFGHIVVVPGGRPCSCGKAGCLERYASGTALRATFEQMYEDFAPHNPAVTEPTGLPKEASGEDIARAARAGDPLAVAVMEDFSRWLGAGLSMVADILDPQLIVLGGGVSRESDLFLQGAQAAMEAGMVGAGHRPVPSVAAAQLGSAAGMIGVAELARRHVVGSAAE